MSFRDDDATRHSLDAADDHSEAEVDLDSLELEELDAAAFQPPSARSLRRALHRSDSSGGEEGTGAPSTTRLLEALEALSSETGGAMPPSLRSLLSQLQGDENGMAGLLPFMQLLDSQGSHPRFQRMLQSIGADAPAHMQLSGLSELCESLSMSSEEGLAVSGFSVDKFLPAVIHLIQAPSTMEVLLLATRALSSMFDMFSSTAIPKAMALDFESESNLVESICDKLMEIEYMDVAEMAFQILERIVFSPHAGLTTTMTATTSSSSSSQVLDYRRAVIEANGFVALLQFVDFFPIENQRTAAHVVAGLCVNIGVESINELHAALPLISNLLRSSDAEIVQHACKSFESLTRSAVFTSVEAFASLVASDATCETLLELLATFAARGDDDAASTASAVSVTACASILQFMLSVLASSHESLKPLVTKLRFASLPPIVAKLLDVPELVEDVVLLRETLKLVAAILPPAETLADNKAHDEKTTILAFAREIVPSVIHVFEVSSRREVRYDCLGVLLRVSLMQQQQHCESLSDLDHLACFLARVLRPESTSAASRERKNEARHICVALQIVQACLQSHDDKAPKTLFERHGVSAAVRCFAQATELFEDGGGVAALSKIIVCEHLGDESADNTSSEDFDQLRKAIRHVESVIKEPTALTAALRDLLALCQQRKHRLESLSGGLWLTAHEITASGLSRLLARLFQDEQGRRVFADVFLTGEASSLVEGLVACVQDAISAEKDVFQVEMTLPDSTIPISTGSIVKDMDQLTQHIKVKVKIDDDELGGGNRASATEFLNLKRNRRTVHNTVVLVEPLARIDTIEDFIAEKLFGSRARVGVFGDGEDEDEAFGSSRGRRRGERRSDSVDSEEKNGDAEDDDQDEDGENDDLRETPKKQKRLQVLYGGVEMKGDRSVLEAILKSDASSVLRDAANDLTKVWTGAPHEFVFRMLSKKQEEPVVVAAFTSEDDVASVPASTESPQALEASTPATATQSSSSSQWWDDVWDLLEILKHLHGLLVLKESDDHVAQKKKQFENAYISLQVTRALTQPIRVMTNSLPSWCSRIVEAYPFVLDYETRYAFMYATTSGAPRAISTLCRTLWKKTALAEDSTPSASVGRNGILSPRLSRRLVRDRNGASSSRSSATAAITNLSRIAKLPRLKVRVARARLLQSAMKLFTMYGGKKAIVEIEFLGEVGTGLGPTTEFYTLVCHELQAARLKLWRNDKEVPTAVDDDASEAAAAKKKKKASTRDDDTSKKQGLPIRGYHRIAVAHCGSCKHLEVLRCATHDVLLTHEKTETDAETGTTRSIPQCAKCLDTRDWYTAFQTCRACSKASSTASTAAVAAAASEDDVASATQSQSELSAAAESAKQCTLKWWILSEEEAQYLHKVYPRDVETLKHPVLQCSHCETVNFPGTDAGIVVLDHTGERMVSRAGRRMFERDYRAVTKHVSPLCEGTPLKQIGVVLTRDAVETLVDCAKKSPELLDSEVESLSYMSEVAMQGEVEVVDAPFGLFPKPLKPATKQEPVVKTKAKHAEVPTVLSWFNFMGRFVAQAILDERLLNLPLSRAFLRALRGETLVGEGVEMARSLAFVREVDPAIAQSLTYLYTLARQLTEATEACDAGVLEATQLEIEAMCLAFTLVGDAAIELCDDGANVAVTSANLSEYVRLNVSFLLHESIQQQVAAFHVGFQTIAGYDDATTFLKSFSLRELEFMLADQSLPGDSLWGRDGKELRENMVCDHGYTAHSRAIHDLVAILCELSLDEQRLFVKFVTGANRLPLGGLARLEPKLTVVRKLATSGGDGEDAGMADAVLPSASTCTNYLKLPEYSTREAMKSRLLYCIHEGQGSFHLS